MCRHTIIKHYNVRTVVSRLLIITVLIMDMCVGYKILVVFPNPSRSHGNLGDGLVRHLLRAGNQVTYITPFAKSIPQPNLTFIDVSCTSKTNEESPYSIEDLMRKKVKLDQDRIFHLMKNISELAFNSDNMIKFLEDPNQKFDVVIAEWMFNELYSGFSAVFKCPYIWVFPFDPNFVATSLIDESVNPAYAPNFELNIVPPFTFVERVRNLWFQMSYRFNYYYYHKSLEEATFKRVFAPILLKKHGSIVPYDVLRYNASLMFSYSHSSLGQSLSIPQNLIPVGGYHVDDEPAPLDENLKDIMEKAKEGVIYFSMGSNLKSKTFPKEFLVDLIEIFRDINHTVLWKFEEDITGYTDNVHIMPWAPQQSILAHPKCILFITHGGLLSTMEAVHHGVPIIGIPVFYDQFNNVDRAVKRGFAKKVMLSQNFANDLKSAIKDLLTDVRYAAKVKELSFVYHHRPISPGATLVHWVQHVVATQGAYHLRSPALLVPWYQKLYLDLIAVATFFLACKTWIMRKLLSRYREYRLDVLRKKKN